MQYNICSTVYTVNILPSKQWTELIELFCKYRVSGQIIEFMKKVIQTVLLRQKEARIEKRWRVWTAKQYVIYTVYFKSSKTSNRFLVVYKRQFTGSEASWSGLTGSGASRTAVQVGCLGKVMLGAGVVATARFPGLLTAGIATRQSMCRIGYRLPGPLVWAGHLHGIQRVDVVHDNPS